MSAATRLFVPPPIPGAREQVMALRAAGDHAAADGLERMLRTPTAVWFTGGSPAATKTSVRATMAAAAAQGAVPVLVAYAIPFRDCAQYSAGSAAGTDAYRAWIDAFAEGIGGGHAIVILEPDSLGIIPWYRPHGSGPPEWCRPAGADPDTAAAERFRQLNLAVDRLARQPGTSTYLDGTHPAWLAAEDAAVRLVRAGVRRARGFFLNVSSFQPTDAAEGYGRRVSSCIAGRPGSPDTPFVVDTSRNGAGPWDPGEHPAGDPEAWCNPPGRRLGPAPAMRPGGDLVDAWLWIKVPGASDGQCHRWAPPGSPDPVWGVVDPPAGAWFPELALELAAGPAP